MNKKETDIINDIVNQNEVETVESSDNKEFNYYDKSIKKNKYYKELEKEVDEYMKNPTVIIENKGPNLVNIHKPLLKLLLVFIVALIFVNFLSSKTNKYPEITGLWGDDKGNYYEIYNETFEMNSGDSNNPFYIGNITNVVKTESGYIVLVKGIKYKYDKDNTLIYDKELEIVFKIENYTSELKTVMNASIGDEKYKIVRLENTPKTNR